MPELSQRTLPFTDSVIRRMTRVSLRYGAVNLSQGFPDFDPPKDDRSTVWREVAHEDFTPVFHHLGRAELPRGAGRKAVPPDGPRKSTPTARSSSPAAAPRP